VRSYYGAIETARQHIGEINLDVYEQELKSYMDEKGLGYTAFARSLGKSAQSVFSWVQRNQDLDDREVVVVVDEATEEIQRIESRKVVWSK